jgi:hypothetical protein
MSMFIVIDKHLNNGFYVTSIDLSDYFIIIEQDETTYFYSFLLKIY